MKKITSLFTAIAISNLALMAQTGAVKRFSLLNQRNMPSSAISTTVATVLTLNATIPDVQNGVPQQVPTAKPKTISSAPKVKKEPIKDYSIFVLNGASSTLSTTSIQAKFGFDGDAKDSTAIELYKVELKDGNRIFSVIPGKTNAIKIAISFLEKIPEGQGTSRDDKRTTINQVLLPDYLTAGEYVFIDKKSISADGTQINVYAFTIL